MVLPGHWSPEPHPESQPGDLHRDRQVKQLGQLSGSDQCLD